MMPLRTSILKEQLVRHLSICEHCVMLILSGGAYHGPVENIVVELDPGNWQNPGFALLSIPNVYFFVQIEWLCRYTPRAGCQWDSSAVSQSLQNTSSLLAKTTLPLVVTTGVTPTTMIQVSPTFYFMDFGKKCCQMWCNHQTYCFLKLI